MVICSYVFRFWDAIAYRMCNKPNNELSCYRNFENRNINYIDIVKESGDALCTFENRNINYIDIVKESGDALCTFENRNINYIDIVKESGDALCTWITTTQKWMK